EEPGERYAKEHGRLPSRAERERVGPSPVVTMLGRSARRPGAVRYGPPVMVAPRAIDAFLLSREWRDADDGVEIVLWARATDMPVRVRLPRQEAVMFVRRDAVT